MGLKRGFKSAAQRILFSFEQFGRHELANHAAAGAYAFLLSAVPALLVVAWASALVATLLRLDVAFASTLVAPYLEAFGGGQALAALFGNALSGAAGALGLINLVWAGRLFVVSIQRGIRVVYEGTARVNPVRENILTFAVELLVLLAAVALIAASQLIRAMSSSVNWAPVRGILGTMVPLLLAVLPSLALWLFIFLTYRNIPAKRPRTGTAALCSALSLGLYGLFGLGVGTLMNVERYGLLYGILGNLVLGLVKVYTFFWMYYFFAELMFTIDHFDSLLFARFHRLQSSASPANALERSLFAEPPRLMRKYARTYAAGSVIFAGGDSGREVFYLYRGQVDVYLDDPVRSGHLASAVCVDTNASVDARVDVSVDARADASSGIEGGAPVSCVGEGEFFGEMASVLDEDRSAWAVARTDCTVFVLPPAVFRRYLEQDRDANARLVGLLAGRLRANNSKLRAGGRQ